MAGIEVKLSAERYTNYYIFKIILPLVVIILMSFAVFWIDPAQIGPQISIATLSVLTLIAYRFSLGMLVPRVSYLIRLDLFIFGATVLVFIAFLETVWTSRLTLRDKHSRALRFDRIGRIAGPVLLLLLLWYSFG